MLTEFKAGDKLKQIVLCKVQKIGASSNGGVFARGTISDNTASLPFITFESRVVEELKVLAGPAAFLVTGTIDINRYASDGSLQFMMNKLEEPLSTDDLTILLPDGGVDLKKYEEKFKNIVNKINDEELKNLMREVFKGTLFYSFRTNPAGMTYHHAYVGGLLEHSVDVAELSLSMGEAIKDVDFDLLIAGALLHDLGKLREISQDLGFPYTEEGQLLGHISIASIMVSEAATRLSEPIKPEKLQELLHIILSHHGNQEKGSPVACKTKEAFIVHYADELDSAMNQFRHPVNENKWQYSKMLGRNIMYTNLDANKGI